jgi:cytoskeletal protein CcmA (bactofilin family)
MSYTNANFDPTAVPERRSPAGATAPSDVAAESADVEKLPVLGKTLLFRGELTAEEDLILQGRVEGSIRHARNLTIGPDGSVLGDVHANHLVVEGLVEGDLYCAAAVIVRSSAQVRGNIFAPRIGIMEGALFNGRVEMDASGAAAQSGSQANSRQNPKPTGAQRAAGPAAQPRPGLSVAPGRASPSAGADSGASLATHAPLTNPAVDQILTAPAKK